MSSLLEELNKNKAIEDAVQPNKMSKFAYTEKAYEDNTAAGVDSFDFEAEQNIPSDKLTVLQTNETVILKGFRAQASSVTRQLLNHFFGRASYNLNKVHDVVKGVLDAFVNYIGKANGVATLDENGRIPYSQLPESVMEFKGTWDASNNTPTLADGTGDTGDFYVVSVAGTQDLGSGEIKFLENDRVIYSEGVWSKLSTGDVRTVNTIQPTDGNVTLTGDNINLSGSDTTKVSTKVTSHINATTGVHGAVSTATASKIIIRDASGRAQVANPSANNDIANKSYTDTGDNNVRSALNSHTAATTGVHGATSAATANKLIIRDAAGRAQIASPSVDSDIANKKFVEDKFVNTKITGTLTVEGNINDVNIRGTKGCISIGNRYPSTRGYNIDIGDEALCNQQARSADNIAIGRRAGKSITTGKGNIVLGYSKGAVTTGSNNTEINGDVPTPLETYDKTLTINNLNQVIFTADVTEAFVCQVLSSINTIGGRVAVILDASTFHGTTIQIAYPTYTIYNSGNIVVKTLDANSQNTIGEKYTLLMQNYN